MRAQTALFLGLMACVGVTATPASARDFVAHATTNPVLYRYAACVFAGDAESAEAQIEKCGPLKAQLETEADAAIERFHVIERVDVERELRKGMREIERDLSATRERNRPVPHAIVGYLRCMGEGAMATADYQSGDAVSYIGLENACQAEHIESVKDTVSDSEAATIRTLHRRFERSGRLAYPQARLAQRRSLARTALLPSVLMDRSFLNMGLLRAASDD